MSSYDFEVLEDVVEVTRLNLIGVYCLHCLDMSHNKKCDNKPIYYNYNTHVIVNFSFGNH